MICSRLSYHQISVREITLISILSDCFYISVREDSFYKYFQHRHDESSSQSVNGNVASTSDHVNGCEINRNLTE